MSSPFDFDKPIPPNEVMSQWLLDATTKRRERETSAPILGCAVASILTMVITGIGVGGFLWFKYEGDNSEMLEAQIKWTVLINRKLAILQERQFWTWRDLDAADALDAEEKRINREFDNHDKKMQSKWGPKLKTLGQLDRLKADQANMLTTRSQHEIDNILRAADSSIREEYKDARRGMVDEVFRNRPLDEPKFFDPMTFRGEIQQREHDIRQAAKDRVIAAQRNLDISDRDIKLRSSVYSKWATKAHLDVKKKLRQLEDDFTKKYNP